MRTKFFIIFILAVVSFVVWGIISAQGLVNIQYPVQELGGCKNQAECKAYCDKPENTEVCMSFAKENNIMSDQEIAVAEKFLSGNLDGPGGCTDKDTCEKYCEDITHINECISFAEKNNILPPQELEEAKKVQAAIASGVKPPACGNKKECDAYCDDSAHMEECINFAMQAGFIEGKELEDAQKMLQAIKNGATPPPCKGKKACDEYCSMPENMEVCINFAAAAGFMSEQELADSQKMLQAIKNGATPPKCKGREECDVYCGQAEHFEECMNFAVAAGFMSEEDAVIARKTGGKGPGDCKGKEECEAFCNNPANQETCFNFAKDNGMISEDDLKRMEQGKQQAAEAFNNASEETIQCLNDALGADTVEGIKNGTAMMSQEIGDKMQNCFMQNNNGAPNVPCTTPEECSKFQPGPGEINPGSQMMPQQAGPGGCRTPEECQTFCQNSPEQCQNFSTPPTEQIIPEDQRPLNQPCQGEICQGQNIQPPSFGEPGSGGTMAPGTQEVPLAPPTNPTPPAEQQPQQPSSENPPPTPPSSFLNSDYLIGSLVNAILGYFFLLH